jgi:hypothetical protein
MADKKEQLKQLMKKTREQKAQASGSQKIDSPLVKYPFYITKFMLQQQIFLHSQDTTIRAKQYVKHAMKSSKLK